MDEYDISSMAKTKEDLSVEDEIKKELRNEISTLNKELGQLNKELNKTKEKLEKREVELEEAKKKFTFLVRRKIKKILGIVKKEEMN